MMPLVFCLQMQGIGKAAGSIETWSYRWASEIFHEFGTAGDGLGSGSGTQGGSGEAPLPLELRSAVTAPARPGFRCGNGKVYVREGRHNLRTEVPSTSAGSLAWGTPIRRPAVCARTVVCRGFRAVDACVSPHPREASTQPNLPSRVCNTLPMCLPQHTLRKSVTWSVGATHGQP